MDCAPQVSSTPNEAFALEIAQFAIFLTMNLIRLVLERPEFDTAPPILFDVGASGGLNPAWKNLARYSVCVAFDPDDREMGGTRKASSVYRELHIFTRALTSGPEGSSEFYLTQSPPCSSLLRPNHEKLSDWEFADRFAIVKKCTIETIQVTTALQKLHLERVDWFKTDSQGIDLRLFLSLGNSIISKVMVAEFEPGIIDAYQGDDKLWNVLRSMNDLGFWMSDMVIKGSNRIRKNLLDGFSQFERNYMMNLLKVSPGWAEVTYLNSFTADDFSKRDYLLGWVCACLRKQHGFALELAAAAQRRFEDTIFDTLKKYSFGKIRTSYFRLPVYFSLLNRALRKWKKVGFPAIIASGAVRKIGEP